MSLADLKLVTFRKNKEGQHAQRVLQLQELPLYRDLTEKQLRLLMTYSPPGYLEFYNQYLSPLYNPDLENKSDAEVLETLTTLDKIDISPWLAQTIQKQNQAVQNLAIKLKELVIRTRPLRIKHALTEEILDEDIRQVQEFVSSIESKWKKFSTAETKSLKDYNQLMESYSSLKDLYLLEFSLTLDQASFNKMARHTNGERNEDLELYRSGPASLMKTLHRLNWALLHNLASSRKEPDEILLKSLTPEFKTEDNQSIRILNKESNFSFFWISSPRLCIEPKNLQMPWADGSPKLFRGFEIHDEAHAIGARNYLFHQLLESSRDCQITKSGLLNRVKAMVAASMKLTLEGLEIYDQLQSFQNRRALSSFQRGLLETLYFYWNRESIDKDLLSVFKQFRSGRTFRSFDTLMRRLTDPKDLGMAFVGATQTKREDLQSAVQLYKDFLLEFAKKNEGSNNKCREILNHNLLPLSGNKEHL